MAFVYKHGEFCCGDLPLTTIAEACGTPTFVYDFDAIRRQVQALQQSLSELSPLIAFAVKSNANLTLLRFLANLGCGFDIVSGGEFYRVLQAGGEANRVVFPGVGKRRDEIRDAVDQGVLMLAVESGEELAAVAEVAKQLKKKAAISLRINPEIDAKTHPYLATSLRESKFGVAHTEGLQLFKQAADSPHLEVVGMSVHIGTQVFTEQPFVELCNFCKDYHERLKANGVVLRYLDIGGGLGIAHKAEDETVTPQRYGEIISQYLGELDLQLIIEPGRSVVGNAGVLLSSVLYRKQNFDKRFVVLDASMGELIRPSLYGAYHEILPLKEKRAALSPADWVGPICESADFLAKARPSPEVAQGEQVALLSAGAYGFVMASNYCGRPRPAEVAVMDGKWYLIRKRESYEDLIRGEEIVDLPIN